MFNFDPFKDVKSVTDVRDRKRAAQAREIYQQALWHIKRYKRINSKRDLIEASNKLFEALRTYRRMVEPYVWLAYIFQIMDRDDMALKYLKIAEAFEPDFPQIIKLKILIERKYALNPDMVSTYEEIAEEKIAARANGGKKSLDEKNIDELIRIANPLKILASTFINQVTKSAHLDNGKNK